MGAARISTGAILLALACCLSAQPRHRTFSPPLRPLVPAVPDLGLPQVQPIPMLGMPAPRAHPARPPFRPAHFQGYSAFPYAPAYVGAYAPAYPSGDTTNIVIVQPTTVVSSPPAPPPAPPEPIRPALIEVKSALLSEPPPLDPPPPFVLVDRAGTERLAVAVVAIGESVHYVDPSDRHHRIALRDLDPEETRRRNRDRNLVLRLPAP